MHPCLKMKEKRYEIDKRPISGSPGCLCLRGKGVRLTFRKRYTGKLHREGCVKKPMLSHIISILVLTFVFRAETAFCGDPLVGTYWVEENGKYSKFIAVKKTGTQYSMAEIDESTDQPSEPWIPLTLFGPETKKPWMVSSGLGQEIPSFTGLEWRDNTSGNQEFLPPYLYLIKAPKKSVFRGARGTPHENLFKRTGYVLHVSGYIFPVHRNRRERKRRNKSARSHLSINALAKRAPEGILKTLPLLAPQ